MASARSGLVVNSGDSSISCERPAHFLLRRLFFLLYGQQPNELALKKLAMFGCAALVFAHAVKTGIPANSYAGAQTAVAQWRLAVFAQAPLAVGDCRCLNGCACSSCTSVSATIHEVECVLAYRSAAGLLLHGSDGKQKVGAGKSAVLLLSRLLMGSLFVFVGVTQIQRVIARDWVLHVQVGRVHLLTPISCHLVQYPISLACGCSCIRACASQARALPHVVHRCSSGDLNQPLLCGAA